MKISYGHSKISWLSHLAELYRLSGDYQKGKEIQRIITKLSKGK